MTDKTNEILNFSSDYLEGTDPRILMRLLDTNLMQLPGYGFDPITESAKDRIRRACACPGAEVQFLIGGTQTNRVSIDARLSPWQGVIAADTGHVSVHEAGAIEAGGHKVLTVPGENGKMTSAVLGDYLAGFFADENHDHMVFPGMVYLSQPTEFGTLYTKSELQKIRDLCDQYHLALYIDGARLAYALASDENDVTLKDLAVLCDVFYIGGTKCGALIGEAVVVPDPSRTPHFFTQIKQHGALLAKGRLTGIQFDELFKDDLYFSIGRTADMQAQEIQQALKSRGYELLFPSPTNQVFVMMDNHCMEELQKSVVFSKWEAKDRDHTIIRFATSWATKESDVKALIDLL